MLPKLRNVHCVAKDWEALPEVYAFETIRGAQQAQHPAIPALPNFPTPSHQLAKLLALYAAVRQVVVGSPIGINIAVASAVVTRQVKLPWVSVLTRVGVARRTAHHGHFTAELRHGPADLRTSQRQRRLRPPGRPKCTMNRYTLEPAQLHGRQRGVPGTKCNRSTHGLSPQCFEAARQRFRSPTHPREACMHRQG